MSEWLTCYACNTAFDASACGECPHCLPPRSPTASARQEGGSHYTSKKIQPWDAMEAWMSKEAFCGFLLGNSIKYCARYKDKGGVEDLKKARHYLDKLIETESE